MTSPKKPLHRRLLDKCYQHIKCVYGLAGSHFKLAQLLCCVSELILAQLDVCLLKFEPVSSTYPCKLWPAAPAMLADRALSSACQKLLISRGEMPYNSAGRCQLLATEQKPDLSYWQDSTTTIRSRLQHQWTAKRNSQTRATLYSKYRARSHMSKHPQPNSRVRV